MLNIERPQSFQGIRFLPLLEGNKNQYRPHLFSEATHGGGRRSPRKAEDRYKIISCRGDGWKYIFDEEENKKELYNLKKDSLEKKILIHLGQDKAKEFNALVKEHLFMIEKESKLYEKERKTYSPQEDEEINRRLAALGYL